METVSHDGRTTAYRATGFGSGPQVCHVHGAGGTHGVWVEQYGDRDGTPAVAVDLSGHGDSDDVDAAPGTERSTATAGGPSRSPYCSTQTPWVPPAPWT